MIEDHSYNHHLHFERLPRYLRMLIYLDGLLLRSKVARILCII
jgi:hypothetical protein